MKRSSGRGTGCCIASPSWRATQTAWLVYFVVLGAGGLRSCPSDGLAPYAGPSALSLRKSLKAMGLGGD
jgi:hypothetical protein